MTTRTQRTTLHLDSSQRSEIEAIFGRDVESLTLLVEDQPAGPSNTVGLRTLKVDTIASVPGGEVSMILN